MITNKSTIEQRRKGSETALGAQKQGHSLPHPCTPMSVALLQTSAHRRVGAKSEGSVPKKIKVISLGSLHCSHPSNLAQTAHSTESPTGFPLPSHLLTCKFKLFNLKDASSHSGTLILHAAVAKKM